jgi:hypothetical protein
LIDGDMLRAIGMLLRLLKLCLFLSGCLLPLLSSCSHQPRLEAFENSIGHVSQDELIRQFGYPQRLKKLPLGNEVWDYEFLAGNSRCVGYRVYFDEEQRSQRWERTACR